LYVKGLRKNGEIDAWFIFLASSSSSSADVAPLVGPHDDSDVAIGAADVVKADFPSS